MKRLDLGYVYLKLISIYLIIPPVLAQSLEQQIDKTARKGRTLLLAMLPLFALAIAYAYKSGNSQAGERLKQVIIGTIIAVSAFGLRAYF